MLYVKLARRNLKRSLKEYGIYVMTVTITVTLLYAFFAIAYSQEMASLVTTFENIKRIIQMVSVLVTLIIAWLIYYISNFILQKRSREFGMYLLMGMRRFQVSTMFLLEQLALGLVSFLAGCGLGVFVYELLHAMIMQVFHFSYQFQLHFSFAAFRSTLLCFIGIYVLELLREAYALRKHSIHSLLYAQKQKETVFKGKKLSLFYFILALLSATAGLWLLHTGIKSLMTNDGPQMLSLYGGILLIIVSIYLFFFSISAVSEAFFRRHHKLKYKGHFMYMQGQLSHRLRSNRAVLATLSVLTLLTMVFSSLGMKFNEVKDLNARRFGPYDITLSNASPLNVTSLTTYLKQHHLKYTAQEVTFYQAPEKDPFSQALPKNSYYSDEDHAMLMGLSDYNGLRQLLQKERVSLALDAYILVCSKDVKKPLLQQAQSKPFRLHQQTLKLAAVDTNEYSQSDYTGYFLIVNDQLLQGATPYLYKWNAVTEKETTAFLYKETRDQLEQDNAEKHDDGYFSFLYYRVKGKWMEENAVSYVSICFSLFYLAFIFVCISATILAVQQLSDAHRQRYSYATLHKIGVSRTTLHGLLAKQIAIYFFIPVVLPLVYLLPITGMLQSVFQMTYAKGSMFTYLLLSLFVFLLVYVCYYVMAYLGCKRNVDEMR